MTLLRVQRRSQQGLWPRSQCLFPALLLRRAVHDQYLLSFATCDNPHNKTHQTEHSHCCLFYNTDLIPEPQGGLDTNASTWHSGHCPPDPSVGLRLGSLSLNSSHQPYQATPPCQVSCIYFPVTLLMLPHCCISGQKLPHTYISGKVFTPSHPHPKLKLSI